MTLVFVTHQVDQVRNLCDRARWLDHGEMETISNPGGAETEEVARRATQRWQHRPQRGEFPVRYLRR